MTKNDFAKFLRGFFIEYFLAERGISSNTLRSYGTAFASYLDFMRVKRKVDAEKLTFEHMGRKNVLDYLDWLQTDKSNSVSTRNQRLATDGNGPDGQCGHHHRRNGPIPPGASRRRRPGSHAGQPRQRRGLGALGRPHHHFLS